MSKIKITAGPFSFVAEFETKAAPKTCASFLKRLPYQGRLIHVRWSGEALWIPLGGADFGVACENATSYPSAGQILLYPGGVSETEILLAYGAVSFASKAGQLAGNHFMTIVSGQEQLPALGRKSLWEGAQPVNFELMNVEL